MVQEECIIVLLDLMKTVRGGLPEEVTFELRAEG